MFASSQWETTLQCNVVSHWQGANTKYLSNHNKAKGSPERVHNSWDTLYVRLFRNSMSESSKPPHNLRTRYVIYISLKRSRVLWPPGDLLFWYRYIMVCVTLCTRKSGQDWRDIQKNEYSLKDSGNVWHIVLQEPQENSAFVHGLQVGRNNAVYWWNWVYLGRPVNFVDIMFWDNFVFWWKELECAWFTKLQLLHTVGS